MEPKKAAKQKRHKKRKSRTHDFSDHDDDDSEDEQVNRVEGGHAGSPEAPKNMTDAEISTAFKKSYLHRATTEFSEDLDLIRGADDFREDALPLLIKALQQGTMGFSIDEQRKVVAAREKDRNLDRNG